MKARPISVCLLGASLSTGNRGVSALASGTVTSLLHSFPGAQVFLLDYAYEPAQHIVHCPGGPAEVELVNIRFSKKILLRNNIARLLLTAFLSRLLPRNWRLAWLGRNPYLKRLLDADVIASIAGGDSFSDIYGLGRLLYVALPQLLVLQLGKPLVLLPQTLGPFKGMWAKTIARFILRRAAVVYSRDRTSFSEAEQLLGEDKDRLKFSHDMAFVMEAVKPLSPGLATLPPRHPAPLIGINVSGLLLMGGYTRDNMFGLKLDYAVLLREIIRYFVREQGANILLVAHVFGDTGEADNPACARLCEELRSEYGDRIFYLRDDFNQHEVKYVIGQCDFFLGSRMHACIAALSQCVPAVCLAYSRKFIGVMESIGCAELAVDMCALDQEAVMKAVRDIFTERSRIRDALQGRMADVRREVLKLFAPENLRGAGIDLPAAHEDGAPIEPGAARDARRGSGFAPVPKTAEGSSNRNS